MGKLNIKATFFDGLYEIEPIIHTDDRGSFSRIFCHNELSEIFKDNNIKQVNHSITLKKGTVRGLHFQYLPDCEIKMVKCVKGKVWDVVVDIRKNSSTFLQWYALELSPENRKMIYIPEGFAHGFQTLEDNTELLYFHSSIYSPNNEGALNLNDPLLDIKWPLDKIDVSKRDQSHSFIDKHFKGIDV